MSFTVKEVAVNDSLLLFEMMEEYSNETNFKNITFANTRSSFIRDCFEEKSNVKFLVAEFNGNFLGYCAFQYPYDVFKDSYTHINEIYVKKEYRKIGVALFLFSKIIDDALKNESSTITWNVDVSDVKLLEIQKKIGATVNEDVLILHAFKEGLDRFLKATPLNNAIEVHFAKNYELPDIYDCMAELAKITKNDIDTDVYKLMKNGFSIHKKFKILTTTLNDEVTGFMSFYHSYNTGCGKSLVVDKAFIKKEFRKKGLGQALLLKLFDYAVKNNFQSVETSISKFEVEKIEQLKEFEIYPYNNLRIATYKKEAFKEFHK